MIPRSAECAQRHFGTLTNATARGGGVCCNVALRPRIEDDEAGAPGHGRECCMRRRIEASAGQFATADEHVHTHTLYGSLRFCRALAESRDIGGHQACRRETDRGRLELAFASRRQG